MAQGAGPNCHVVARRRDAWDSPKIWRDDVADQASQEIRDASDDLRGSPCLRYFTQPLMNMG